MLSSWKPGRLAIGDCSKNGKKFSAEEPHLSAFKYPAGNYGAPPPRTRGNLDGLVPDMQQQNANGMKRQRLDN